MFRRWFAVEKHQSHVKCILVSTATTKGAREEACRGAELCARHLFYCYQTDRGSPTDIFFSRSGVNHVPTRAPASESLAKCLQTLQVFVVVFLDGSSALATATGSARQGVVTAGSTSACLCASSSLTEATQAWLWFTLWS